MKPVNWDSKTSLWTKYLYDLIIDDHNSDSLDVLRYYTCCTESIENTNDISKGKKEMTKTEAQIRYEEKCNEAKMAYDEALRIAREELNAAEQKKTCDDAANMMKDLYDSYIAAGFTPTQAEKFVTIALEKGK